MAAPKFHKMPTHYEDISIIQRSLHSDERGVLGKIYNKELFFNLEINSKFDECIYNISHKNVLRGMHYQKPPFEQEKLISVIQGSILSVLLGIGENKGRLFSIKLSAQNMKSLFISKNYAHGFICLEDNTLWVQHSSKSFSERHYGGFHWNSFGFDWGIRNPIVSEKDNKLSNYDSKDCI